VIAPSLHFPELDLPLLQHVFTLRHPTPLPQTCRDSLRAVGFPCQHWVEAEQPHSNQVAHVDLQHSGSVIPGVDALMTDQPSLTLAVRTADCGPLFLYDPVHHAIALAHSGKKGTQARILEKVISAMRETYQSNPTDLIVVLGPCIRPPHYTPDFAAEIGHQAQRCGILHYHDCLLNTGIDLERFYSYRVEKGQTGRHYAALRLEPKAEQN
jgi:polyphenol oxidase